MPPYYGGCRRDARPAYSFLIIIAGIQHLRLCIQARPQAHRWPNAPAGSLLLYDDSFFFFAKIYTVHIYIKSKLYEVSLDTISLPDMPPGNNILQSIGIPRVAVVNTVIRKTKNPIKFQYPDDIINRRFGILKLAGKDLRTSPDLTELHPSATHTSTAVARVSFSVLLSKHKSRKYIYVEKQPYMRSCVV